jgi:hypothetical protein
MDFAKIRLAFIIESPGIQMIDEIFDPWVATDNGLALGNNVSSEVADTRSW